MTPTVRVWLPPKTDMNTYGTLTSTGWKVCEARGRMQRPHHLLRLCAHVWRAEMPHQLGLDHKLVSGVRQLPHGRQLTPADWRFSNRKTPMSEGWFTFFTSQRGGSGCSERKRKWIVSHRLTSEWNWAHAGYDKAQCASNVMHSWGRGLELNNTGPFAEFLINQCYLCPNKICITNRDVMFNHEPVENQ